MTYVEESLAVRDNVLEHVTRAGNLLGDLVIAVNHRTRLETRGTVHCTVRSTCHIRLFSNVLLHETQSESVARLVEHCLPLVSVGDERGEAMNDLAHARQDLEVRVGQRQHGTALQFELEVGHGIEL